MTPPIWMAAALLALSGSALAAGNKNSQAARIQPQDGLWAWDMGQAQGSATCLPGLAESLQGLLPQQRSEQMRFENPFHPAQLVDDTRVQWERRSPNHFVARASNVRLQGFALPLDAHYELQVISPTRMQGRARVHLEAWQPCTVTAPFEFHRRGA